MKSFVKIIAGAGMLLFATLIIAGCRTAKIINYVHKPSEEFYKSMDSEAEKLEEFKDEETLFVIDIKEFRHGQYAVWLGLYSKKPQPLVINEARAFGDDWANTSKINEKVSVESMVEGGRLMKTSVRLFNIESEALDKHISDNPTFTIELKYTISGVMKTMVFYIERKEEKQTVFRT